jgi:hypothetical protein
MRSLTLRKAAVAATLPLALSTLAACGGGDSSATATDTQASSPTTGSTTSDAQPGAGRSVDPADFLATIKAAATSITTARFTMEMDLSGQTLNAKGALDMTGDTPAMQVTMDLPGMTTSTDMRLVDGVMYIQDPTSSSGMYLKMDLSDPNGPLAGLGDALTNYDPQSMIDQMSADAFRKVTDLGPQTIGGQRLEHYHVVLDTSAAMKLLQNAPTTADIPKTIGYDMWLDSQHRMNRFTMLMKKVLKVTATYTDYGADVHITAPDPSQVTAMPSAGSTS